jgi:hypothetical protein
LICVRGAIGAADRANDARWHAAVDRLDFELIFRTARTKNFDLHNDSFVVCAALLCFALLSPPLTF